MMEIFDKRLNDKGKNWRHVFKALTVLDYLLHAGSQNVWMYFHDNIYIVKTLKEFQYQDDAGRDQGVNVRQKAKDITNLLMDESRMNEQRRKRHNMDSRMRRDPNDFTDEEGNRRRRAEASRRDEEDSELKRAIEESKQLAEEEERRKNAQKRNDDDLQRALDMSREEERKREEEERKKKENDNLINFDAENTDASLQPQYTSFNPYLQFQPTGMNPFFQAQMQQQQMQQQQYLQQQEYQRQLQMQHAAQQYQQLMTQQPQQQQPLIPQQTSFGSNNPWLSNAAPAQETPQPVAPAPAPEPQHDTLISFDEPEAVQPAKDTKPKRVITSDAHPELNRLLAMGDGVDTFGNTGDMRMGHNAPLFDNMTQQQTGASALGSAAFGKMSNGAGSGARQGSGAQQRQPDFASDPFF